MYVTGTNELYSLHIHAAHLSTSMPCTLWCKADMNPCIYSDIDMATEKTVLQIHLLNKPNSPFQQCLFLFYPSPSPSYVGCIYASKPFNSSLIYHQHLLSLQFYYQTSKTTEIYFSYFSWIFTDIIFMSFVFSMLLVVQRFVSFASTTTFDSRSRKRLLTHWLYPTIWLPDGQGAKVPGKQVYASETHSRISSLLSVYYH